MSEGAQSPDELAAAGLAALRRARARAEEIARQTGTLLVFAENGRVVHVAPGERPAGNVAEPITEYAARTRPAKR